MKAWGDLMKMLKNIAGRGWYGWLVLGIAIAATIVTWLYGFWKSPTMGLIFLPIGVVVFFASIGALAVPAISATLVAVAAITMVDKGVQPALILATQVFLGFGLLSFVWHLWKAKWRRR